MISLPKSFYPTPPALIDKMLSGVDFARITTVLEPSAGKGDIVKAVHGRMQAARRMYGGDAKIDIDCIELDDNLRHILKGNGYRVVADDFLWYDTAKHYDLIVANPPFEDGDRHLLRMLDMQRHGGNIICLLNAETLHNQYTDTRKALARKLDELGADIEYISGAFATAERKTDVEVAIVRVHIAEATKSFIFDGLQAAAQEAEPEHDDPTALADRDIAKQTAREYTIAADAMRRLFAEYWGLRPYLLDGKVRKDCIIELVLHGYNQDHGNYSSATVNDALPALRKRYWSMLFANPKFVDKLTSNLRHELHERVEELANYDVTEYNIRTIQVEMAQKKVQGLEDTILSMFERLSYTNSWDKGNSKNVHYYDGWATNKAWKVNKKVIQPIAAYDEWRGKYSYYPGRCIDTLTDIEKVFSYLDSKNTPRIDITEAIRRAHDAKSSYVELTYFDVQFYKKGTTHIIFKDHDLLAKFNLYGSQRKGWLPPSYGKRQYQDMAPQEKAVVDAYEGKAAYERVIANPGYYIVESSGLLALAEGVTV